MAQKTIVEWADDLTGEVGEDVATRTFMVGDVQYEIDLSAASYNALAEALAPFMTAGRVVKARNGRPAKPGVSYPGGTVTKGVKSTTGIEQRRAIRGWWKANQKAHDLPPMVERGRIPASVVDAYDKAGAAQVPSQRATRAALVVSPLSFATGTGEAVQAGLREAVAKKAAAAAKATKAAKATTKRVPASKSTRRK